MIGIKKVQVVPVDRNYGKIIDSFNTVDDKTKNAPSLNAVTQKLTEYTKTVNLPVKEVTVIDNQAIIGAETARVIQIEYPTGYTIDNCYPVATGIKVIENRGYNYIGTWTDSADNLDNCYRRRLNLRSDAIYLTIYNPNNNEMTVDYKIVLMKI